MGFEIFIETTAIFRPLEVKNCIIYRPQKMSNMLEMSWEVRLAHATLGSGKSFNKHLVDFELKRVLGNPSISRVCFSVFNIQWRLPTAFRPVLHTPWDLIMNVATDVAPQSVKLNTETHNPAARFINTEMELIRRRAFDSPLVFIALNFLSRRRYTAFWSCEPTWVVLKKVFNTAACAAGTNVIIMACTWKDSFKISPGVAFTVPTNLIKEIHVDG